MRLGIPTVAMLGLLLATGTARAAQGAPASKKPVDAPAKVDEKPSAPNWGIRGQLLNDLNTVEEKLVGLAEAIPADKYTWRPQQGVRSVSEVFLHVANANYGLPTVWGAQPPAGFERKGFEQSTTDKVKVVEALKQSYDHIRQVVTQMPDSELEKQVNLFGREVPVSTVLFVIATHQHEHLGQAIAYARMNGVVPPWTAAREAKQQSGTKKQ